MKDHFENKLSAITKDLFDLVNRMEKMEQRVMEMEENWTEICDNVM